MSCVACHVLFGFAELYSNAATPAERQRSLIPQIGVDYMSHVLNCFAWLLLLTENHRHWMQITQCCTETHKSDILLEASRSIKLNFHLAHAKVRTNLLQIQSPIQSCDKVISEYGKLANPYWCCAKVILIGICVCDFTYPIWFSNPNHTTHTCVCACVKMTGKQKAIQIYAHSHIDPFELASTTNYSTA